MTRTQAPEVAPVRLLVSILPAAVLVPVASTVVAVALPSIMADLAVGEGAIWWLVTGYLALVAVLQAPAGRLGDRLGHRRMVLAGTAVLGAAGGGAALAPDVRALVAARLVQGAAGAAVVPGVMAMIRRELSAEARGRAIGGFTAAMAGGGLLGVAGGGALIGLGGWRVGFGALVVLSGVALAALMGAPRRGGATIPVAAGGTGGGSGTGRVGQSWRALIVPAAGIALVSLTFYVVLLVVPLRLDAVGGSSTSSGLVLGAFILAAAVAAMAESRVDRWLGRRRTLTGAGIAAAAALVAAAVVDPGPGGLAVAVAVAGGGLGAVLSGMFALGLGESAAATAGTASGLLSTARYAGSIVGTATMPLVLDTGGHTASLLVAAAAALLVVPVLATSRIRGRG